MDLDNRPEVPRVRTRRFRFARALALGALAVFALYQLIGFFGVPLALRHWVAPKLAAALSRPVSIGRASFNPNTLALDLGALRIGERESEDGFADVARLYVDASWRSLPGFAPVIDELRVEAPQLSVVRLDTQRFNFSDLIEPSAEAGPPDEESPLRFRIAKLEVRDGTLAYTDRTNEQAVVLRLSPLAFTAADLDGDLGTARKVALSGALDERGEFRLEGTVAAVPLQAALDLSVRDLNVAALEPYFAAQLNAAIARARLSAEGRLSLADEDGSLGIGYSGSATLGDVEMRDKATGDLLARWQALELSRIEAAHAARDTAVDIGTVALRDFYARVILDRQARLNLSRVVRPEGDDARSLTRDAERAAPRSDEAERAERPDASAPAAKLHFGEIRLERGHVNYTDNYIQPNFTADLTDIAGTVGAFGTQSAAPAPVDVQARLDESDPVRIRGAVDPVSEPPFLDLKADARNVVLERFTPYSTKYLGYPILEGRLSVDLHYRLEQGELRAENHVVIDRLRLGDHVPSPTALNLPVRLAISLLKNRRGEIDVEVPVSGSLSDPQFSIGRVVWSAFVGLFEKAVTAPFTLLAGALGGSEELSHIEFAPGSAEVSSAAQDKLDTLAKALVEKPDVELELSGRVDPARDEPALRERYVERQVRLQKIAEEDLQDADPDGVALTPEEYEEYLTAAYKAADFDKERTAIGLTKSLPAAEMRALLAAHVPAEALDLRRLARERAEAVRQRLAGTVAAARIRIAEPDAPDGASRSTRVEFALK